MAIGVLIDGSKNNGILFMWLSSQKTENCSNRYQTFSSGNSLTFGLPLLRLGGRRGPHFLPGTQSPLLRFYKGSPELKSCLRRRLIDIYICVF